MGKKNKSGPKANVFKVAGAKSLKKTKSKPVNLGLKNLKQKVAAIDEQFIKISKTPKPDPSTQKQKVKMPLKKNNKKVTKEDVSKTTEEIVKMELS